MRVLALLNLLVAGYAIRHRRGTHKAAAEAVLERREASAAASTLDASTQRKGDSPAPAPAPPAPTWESDTSPSHGPCASHFGREALHRQPLSFPVLCTSAAAGVTLRVTVDTGYLDNLTFTVNSEYRGLLHTPHPDKWAFGLGDLPQGLSYVSMRQGGSWVSWVTGYDVSLVELEGHNGHCSFTEAPPAGRDAQVNTYKGFDALFRLFGDSRDFPEFQKEQLYFVSETVGKTSDSSIDAGVVSEGWYKWIHEFSQNQPENDRWGHRGVMWNESLITPYPEVSLDPLPGRNGQKMVVQEPCNALSSYSYHMAGVWISCKGYPFDREEMASLVAAFNSLAAGTIFQHACACSTGGRADTFAMDWLVMQIHQSTVRQVVDDAGDRLTEAERNAIMTFDTGVGQVTELAKDMTRLFESKYDHAFWNATMRSVDIPGYMLPIAGLISFVLWAIQGKIGMGTEQLLEGVLNSLIDLFDVPQKDFFVNTYNPAVRKALSFSNLCSNAVMPVVEYTVKFILTFVEALVYQEQTLEIPKEVHDVLRILDDLNITHDLYADMADSWDYYNGFDCLGRSDHAIWHEKAAHGLIHFLNVAEHFRTGLGC